MIAEILKKLERQGGVIPDFPNRSFGTSSHEKVLGLSYSRKRAEALCARVNVLSSRLSKQRDIRGFIGDRDPVENPELAIKLAQEPALSSPFSQEPIPGKCSLNGQETVARRVIQGRHRIPLTTDFFYSYALRGDLVIFDSKQQPIMSQRIRGKRDVKDADYLAVASNDKFTIIRCGSVVGTFKNRIGGQSLDKTASIKLKSFSATNFIRYNDYGGDGEIICTLIHPSTKRLEFLNAQSPVAFMLNKSGELAFLNAATGKIMPIKLPDKISLNALNNVKNIAFSAEQDRLFILTGNADREESKLYSFGFEVQAGQVVLV